MKVYDPPPVKDEYDVWARTATRPLTAPALGVPTSGRRNKAAELSARMRGRERERREWRQIQSPWTGRIYWVIKTRR